MRVRLAGTKGEALLSRWTVLVVVLVLVAAACNSAAGDSPADSDSAGAGAPLECEVDEDPCSQSELSDDVAATGAEPIMGFVWTMEATKTVSFSENTQEQRTGVLTLEFEEGQDIDEPKPRYVVTGGTVTYDGRSRTALGCTYSGGGLTFEVTPDMVPLTKDGFDRNVLIFDTTVTPIEYQGIIQVNGPDYIRTQTCPDSDDAGSVNYGGSSAFMGIVEADHMTVTSPSLIEATFSTGGSVVDQWTITRTK